jgi:hypothetical protein
MPFLHSFSHGFLAIVEQCSKFLFLCIRYLILFEVALLFIFVSLDFHLYSLFSASLFLIALVFTPTDEARKCVMLSAPLPLFPALQQLFARHPCFLVFTSISIAALILPLLRVPALSVSGRCCFVCLSFSSLLFSVTRDVLLFHVQ